MENHGKSWIVICKIMEKAGFLYGKSWKKLDFHMENHGKGWIFMYGKSWEKLDFYMKNHGALVMNNGGQ